ncbi:glycerophosphoryl diester phosphodiesterase [Zunongwangia mangrovi]|uniref:Glycerophosphoryl diester phosphodiesterase n=1 Tax=Zunongwangia mangrovi TaxID=1334022 RepID=A0A1I1LHH8_9FLAO|nr:glycerophosphodiester phosphodiesterase family protein [Zunongwangia mangrovi]SFC72647.1 glycerophosphoryl diester phosphodiesterase [Zunongwangia mangrovi]
MKHKILIVLFLVLECCKAQSISSFQYSRANLLDPSPAVILVAAHRGMHQDYPENSIPAIQEAIDHHLDIVEIDVQITKDGIPILMHDDEVDRTTTGKGEVHKLTYAEICEFKLKDKAGKETAFTVPSLAEVLELSKDKIILDLDLKLKKRHLRKVTRLIEELKAENSVFFYESRHAVIKKIQRQLPGALRMTKISLNRRAVKRAMLKANPEIVHLGNSERDRDPVFIKYLQNYYKKPVFANALGALDLEVEKNPDTLNYFITKGINVIQTDKPELVLNYLVARGKHDQF